MLQKMISDDWSFTEAEKAQIANIANQCPFQSGEGVYRARSLAAIYELNRYDDETICSANLVAPREKRITDCKILCYLNPVKDKLTIMLENRELKIEEVQLSNLGGKVIFTKKPSIKSDEFTLDLSEIHTGLFMVEITLNNGTKTIQKIMKN